MAIVEVCVESIESALAAVTAGCDRLELCNNLALGGTTPSPEWADIALHSIQCPAVILVRSRPGDFCFSNIEKLAMLQSIERYMSLGATGFAVGAVIGDNWDVQFMKQIARVAGCCDLVAHRAIDELLGSQPSTTQRIAELIDPLIELGYRRVLTSGGYASAEQGAVNIRKLVEYAADRIEILPGGGVTPETAIEILHATGASQIHGSFQHTPRSSNQVVFDPLRFLRLKTQLIGSNRSTVNPGPR